MTASTSTPPTRSSPLGYAGWASVGAGIIHLGIAVGHRHDSTVASMSALTGLAQVGWGSWALTHEADDARATSVVGAAISAFALVGWAMAKLTGIALIDGLTDPEPVALADGVAAALAFVALTLAFRAIQVSSPAPGRRAQASGIVAALVVLGSVAVAGWAAGRDQPEDPELVPIESPGLAAAVDTRVENRRFDPAEPIDLSGVPGVTDEELDRAEALLRATLAELPRFADPAVAEQLGYQSLDDAFTGHEHLVNWELIDDGFELDPSRPESLVYEVDDDGDRTLVAAMYMLSTGSRLTSVPDVGGSLTPWHVHENICVDTSSGTPTEGGMADAAGGCPDGQELLSPVPMLHVWVSPHPCGPFASLESVAGLEVGPDEIVFCDHIHGT